MCFRRKKFFPQYFLRTPPPPPCPSHFLTPLYQHLVPLPAVLLDAGVEVDQTDHAGLTALDYAMIRGAPNLALALQRHMNRPMQVSNRSCKVYLQSCVKCLFCFLI